MAEPGAAQTPETAEPRGRIPGHRIGPHRPAASPPSALCSPPRSGGRAQGSGAHARTARTACSDRRPRTAQGLLFLDSSLSPGKSFPSPNFFFFFLDFATSCDSGRPTSFPQALEVPPTDFQVHVTPVGKGGLLPAERGATELFFLAGGSGEREDCGVGLGRKAASVGPAGKGRVLPAVRSPVPAVTQENGPAAASPPPLARRAWAAARSGGTRPTAPLLAAGGWNPASPGS